jgi:predicted RNase H-like HicB family nuclease
VIDRPLTEYTIKFKREKRGGFSAQCVEIPKAIAKGRTREELRDNMSKAIRKIESKSRKSR